MKFKEIILGLLFILFASPAFSQAVQKRDLEIGTGIGFGIYQTNNNDTSVTGMAVSGVIPVYFQYAIIYHLSVGLKFQRNGFLTERDSGNSVQSYLLGPTLTYRAINGEKTTLFFEASGGKSWMHYYAANANNYVDGKGYFIDFTAGMQYFFTNKIGMFTELSYVKQRFTNFKDKHNEMFLVNNIGKIEKFLLTASGMNLRLGLTFKF